MAAIKILVMKMILRRTTNPSSKSFLSINNNLHRFIDTAAEPPHTAAPEEEEDKTAATITNLCNSFSNNLNWKTLNRNLHLSDIQSSSIINKVLIQLKEPPNAKKALSFFHWSSNFANITHSTHTYALLIHILVNAKLTKDASALIESVLNRSVGNCNRNRNGNDSSSVISFIHSLMSSYDVTGSNPSVFDLTIQICAKLRLIDEAIDACFCLGENGFRLSVISYNILLHVIQKSDKTNLVWRVYEHMIDHRIYPNEKSIGTMVSALCKEGKLHDIVNMIDRIDGKRCLPRVIVNTCLIFGMIEEGRISDGLVLLKKFFLKNMILDTISCSLIVYGKIKLGELDSAWKVFDEMLKRGFNPNSFVYTSFIKAYCEAGKIEDGYKLFKDMESLGLQAYNDTYTHMIVGFSKVGRLEESLELCSKMVQNGFLPSCLAFNEVVERVNGHENVHRADEILSLLLEKGFVPDVNTYSYLIAGYGRENDIEKVLKIYYEMEYKKLSPGSLAFSWLVVGLFRAGRLEESEKYLSVMKARSLVSLNYMIDMLISSHEKGEHIKDRS